MLKNNYLSQLETLFFEKGISEHQSQHLIEEIQDRLNQKKMEFQVLGNNAVDAERLAIESIGLPEVVAESVAAELRSNSWIARHPWLLFGIVVLVSSFLLTFAITWLGYIFSGSYSFDHDARSRVSLPILQIDTILFNWIPLLIGLAVLVFLIRFCSIGWKTLFIGSIILGLAAGVMEQWVAFSTTNPRLHLHFNPIISFVFQDWERRRILYYIRETPMTIFIISLPAILKLVIPPGVCLFARYVMPRMRRVEGKNCRRMPS